MTVMLSRLLHCVITLSEVEGGRGWERERERGEDGAALRLDHALDCSLFGA